MQLVASVAVIGAALLAFDVFRVKTKHS